MANTRNSPSPNKLLAIDHAFERALGAIRARVCVSGAPLAVAVAYSGGLDSRVLLQLAAAWGRGSGVRVHALHVHHGLSPNAQAWSEHCEQACAALNMPLEVLRVQVRNAGDGIEAAARQARYTALGDACRRLGLNVLLTGHHQDDQAETVLLQLLRGAGVAGLAAMSALQQESVAGPGIVLGRPLLDIRRAAIAAWAEAHGLRWVEDESNAQTHFRRNAVRHLVLPAIEQAFPNCIDLLARSAAHLQGAQGLLEDLARIDLARCAGHASSLKVEALARLPLERANNLLRYWLHSLSGVLPSAAQLEQLRAQATSAPDAHPLLIFGEFEARRHAGELRLLPRHARQDRSAGPCLRLQWQGQGSIAVPQWGGRLSFTPVTGPALPPELLRGAALELRPRVGHEKLQLAPNRPSRTLKNLYQEAGIPAWRRPGLPLLWQGDQLLFAAGVGADCRFLQDGPGYCLTWESE